MITVLKIQGDQVSLGLEAPKSVAIYREEIHREVEEENTVGVVDTKAAVHVKALAKNLSPSFKNRKGKQKKLSFLKKTRKK